VPGTRKKGKWVRFAIKEREGKKDTVDRVHDLQTPIRVLVPQPLEYEFHMRCTESDLSYDTNMEQQQQ
jgi:hypothetical protein